MSSDRRPSLEHPCWTGQHIGLARVGLDSSGPDDNLVLKVEKHFESGASIDFRLQDLTKPFGPVLRFVDCYGDTFLNEYQVADLVRELREIRERAAAPDLVEHIDALIAFASKGEGFLWFIGD